MEGGLSSGHGEAVSTTVAVDTAGSGSGSMCFDEFGE